MSRTIFKLKDIERLKRPSKIDFVTRDNWRMRGLNGSEWRTCGLPKQDYRHVVNVKPDSLKMGIELLIKGVQWRGRALLQRGLEGELWIPSSKPKHQPRSL